MRPTSYNDGLIEKAKEYIELFNIHPDEKPKGFRELVPTVVGLCRYIERSKSVVYDWAKDESKPEFLDILCQIEELQHSELVNSGLAGAFNPAITKMMLTKHGYSDSIKQDHTSSDGSMSPKGKTLDDFYQDSDVSTKSES